MFMKEKIKLAIESEILSGFISKYAYIPKIMNIIFTFMFQEVGNFRKLPRFPCNFG